MLSRLAMRSSLAAFFACSLLANGASAQNSFVKELSDGEAVVPIPFTSVLSPSVQRYPFRDSKSHETFTLSSPINLTPAKPQETFTLSSPTSLTPAKPHETFTLSSPKSLTPEIPRETFTISSAPGYTPSKPLEASDISTQKAAETGNEGLSGSVTHSSQSTEFLHLPPSRISTVSVSPGFTIPLGPRPEIATSLTQSPSFSTFTITGAVTIPWGLGPEVFSSSNTGPPSSKVVSERGSKTESAKVSVLETHSSKVYEPTYSTYGGVNHVSLSASHTASDIPPNGGCNAVQKSIFDKAASVISMIPEPTGSGMLAHHTLRIMPLGASIIYGVGSSDGNGFRKDLLDYLSTITTSSYIGSVHAGNMTNNNCEAQPGAIIQQMQGFAARSIGQHPNVILIHVGTNNLQSNSNAAGAADALSDLLDWLVKQEPEAVILVAEIIQSTITNIQQHVAAYHDSTAKNVAELASNGSKVLGVRFPSFEDSNLSSDGIHPNDTGYAVMALAFYEQFRNASQLGWISEPRPVSSTYTLVGKTGSTSFGSSPFSKSLLVKTSSSASKHIVISSKSEKATTTDRFPLPTKVFSQTNPRALTPGPSTNTNPTATDAAGSL